MLAESLGVARVWVADSPAIWRELWATLGALGARTDRIRLGSAVTTGATRHPAVTASAALSLAELTAGRFDLGMGTGDSSLVTTGARPPSLDEFRETVGTVRRLLAGETVRMAGADVRIGWAAGPRVPLYVAASGPRMLELAGASADGVIMMVGVGDAMVRAAIERVRAGARAAGREPDDVDLVLWTACAVSDAAPREAVAAVKATVARTVIRTLPLSVDARHAPAVERIRAGYDYAWHSHVSAPHAALVPDELVPEFALAGDARACAEQVQALGALGVSSVALALPDSVPDDRATMLRRLLDSVA